jgi:hypothetical protein
MEMLTTMGLCGVNTIAEIDDNVPAVLGFKRTKFAHEGGCHDQHPHNAKPFHGGPPY